MLPAGKYEKRGTYFHTDQIACRGLHYMAILTNFKFPRQQSVTSRSREFCSFLDGTGTGTGKNWSRKKVPVPVPEKFGPGKKYRYRYRKNLVPEKSTGTGTGENWSRKKVPVPVSEKIGPGTVEFPGTPGHCIFSYLHVPLGTGKRKCPFKGSYHLRKLLF